MIKKIAIVFDQYGNPTQPFLMEWYRRLLGGGEILVKGFSNKVYRGVHQDIFVFKPNWLRRIKQYSIGRLGGILRPELSTVPYRYHTFATFKPDVIHILNAQQFGLYREVIRCLEAKVVLSFRGYETSVRPLEDAAWKKELTSIYDCADRLHFVSDFLRNEALALGAPAEKSVVIRRSVDTDFFSPSPVYKETPILKLLAVGRLTWQKGYKYLLEALARLRLEKYQFSLQIVGDGDEKVGLEAQAKLLGLEGLVDFAGHLDRKSLRNALRMADVFVQASISDALPNSVLEASACGLPVISTTAGGIPEAVVNRFSGILVTPGNAKELEDALRELILNRRLGRELGKNGRKLMQTRFSTLNEAKEWRDFYLSL